MQNLPPPLGLPQSVQNLGATGAEEAEEEEEEGAEKAGGAGRGWADAEKEDWGVAEAAEAFTGAALAACSAGFAGAT